MKKKKKLSFAITTMEIIRMTYTHRNNVLYIYCNVICEDADGIIKYFGV